MATATAKRDSDCSIVFRVVSMPEGVRDAMKTCRAKRGQVLASFLDSAITTELPALVTSLAALGITANEQKRPAGYR